MKEPVAAWGIRAAAARDWGAWVDITGAVAHLADPFDATTKLKNTVSGGIMVVQRGGVGFSAKALLAQETGAEGVLVISNEGSGPVDPTRGLAAGDGSDLINIPVFMIDKVPGGKLLEQLRKGKKVQITFGCAYSLEPKASLFAHT